jgi:MFS family permease
MATHPTLAGVILYYAMTFGVVLAVNPAYMSDASLSNQGIELMFFVCGISLFVTLLLLVTRISKYGVPALAKAVLTTAAGTIISFSLRSLLWFAASIALSCISTSIFYPVSFRLVTMNTPSGHLGSKLGFYNTLFGAGWMAGPIAAGFASDTFGSGGPYHAFFILGSVITAAITIFRKGSNHF